MARERSGRRRNCGWTTRSQDAQSCHWVWPYKGPQRSGLVGLGPSPSNPVRTNLRETASMARAGSKCRSTLSGSFQLLDSTRSLFLRAWPCCPRLRDVGPSWVVHCQDRLCLQRSSRQCYGQATSDVKNQLDCFKAKRALGISQANSLILQRGKLRPRNRKGVIQSHTGEDCRSPKA